MSAPSIGIERSSSTMYFIVRSTASMLLTNPKIDFFKNGTTPASICFFGLFQIQILQRDTNSDRQC